jgi:hypothetical protein
VEKVTDINSIIGVIVPNGEIPFYQVIWFKNGVLTATSIHRNEFSEDLKTLYATAYCLNEALVNSVKHLMRSNTHGDSRENAR